jgi:hypothetical protein
LSGRPWSPNAVLLATAANALGELGESLVLVEGCATEFLITAERAENPRPTDDVDLVAEVVSIPAYHALEAELRKRGFTPDRSDGAPICRWIVDGVKVDILPSEEILGFKNRWFPLSGLDQCTAGVAVGRQDEAHTRARFHSDQVGSIPRSWQGRFSREP